MRVCVISVCALTVICAGALVPSGTAVGQSMEVVVASIDLPDDDDTRTLSGLRYGGKAWWVEFTSIRRDLLSEPDADPMKMVWTLTGRSGRQRPTRVQLTFMLIDGSGKTVVSAQKNGLVTAGADNYEISQKMKVKSKQWSRAKLLRIRVVFLMS